MPEFPGDIREWITAHLVYPRDFQDDMEGIVFVQMVICDDGTIEQPFIIRTSHPVLNEAALRLIRAMPRWKPAQRNGHPVDFSFVIPIRFRPDE